LTLTEEFGRRRTVSVSVPAPISRPEVLLLTMPQRQALLWQPATSGEPAFAGLGAACRIDLSGPERLRDLRQQADAFFERIAIRDSPACQAPSPRFFGGLSFLPASPLATRAPCAGAAPFSAFGDGSFTLPRWRYACDGKAASLTLTVNGEADLLPGWRREVGAEFDALIAALSRGEIHKGPEEGLPPMDIHHQDPAAWRRQVEDILLAIAEGRVEKVVAARRSVVELPRPVRDAEVLSRLRAEQPECTCFAFRRVGGGGSLTFLGATPERLVERRGLNVRSDALAGSIARKGTEREPEDGQRLLKSGKDGEEHAPVVRDIVAALRPFCSRLSVTDRPRIRSLRHVLHLHTAIEGELIAGTHVLELTAALHPTPAVGGAPRAEALRWIAEHEEDRGWYAGPVGWFDGSGDGEFAVAIRSGLLEPGRAHVYAGAGIVRGSDPAAEYRETAVKQLALLRALRAVRD
jgi:isochorismate synthase